MLNCLVFGSHAALTSRLNTFLELKMENQRLQHRVHELRAQKAPLMQTPSTSMAPPSAASTLPSHFGITPSLATSSQLQLPVDPGPRPPPVPDHIESAAANLSPVTRNFDAAGFQEDGQDEPAKKKVRPVERSDAVDVVADT